MGDEAKRLLEAHDRTGYVDDGDFGRMDEACGRAATRIAELEAEIERLRGYLGQVTRELISTQRERDEEKRMRRWIREDDEKWFDTAKARLQDMRRAEAQRDRLAGALNGLGYGKLVRAALAELEAQQDHPSK